MHISVLPICIYGLTLLKRKEGWCITLGKRSTVNRMILISCILVVLIASLSGIMGIIVSKYTESKFSAALVNYGNGQGNAGMCLAALAEADCQASTAINSTDKSVIDTALKDLDAAIATGDEYMAALKETLVSEKALTAFDAAQQSWDSYKKKVSNSADAGAATTDVTESAAIYNSMLSESKQLYQETKEDLSTIMDSKMNDGAALSSELSLKATIGAAVSIILILGALFISFAISRYLRKSIAKPVAECAVRLTAMAEGDLHAPVPEYNKNNEIGDCVTATRVIVETLTTVISDTSDLLTGMSQGDFTVTSKSRESYKGDLEPMLESIRTICFKLNDTLLKINDASDQVDSGSDQVSSGAQALSQGATEQASSVEELAATVNDISQHVTGNAQNAAQVQQLVDSVGNEINESNQQMENMMAAMNQIEDASNEIGKILKTIEDIAFQTNILALNAAVEAARAGAAGKGFAVVADEVRNLAAKSDEAAKSTTALIENAVAAVNNGTQIATDTAQSMASVVTQSSDVVEKINAISTASQEQAEAIAQVTQGIDQISSVVQTNSATAQESAAASEELAGQASLLKGLVAAFKLRSAQEIAALTSQTSYSEPASAPAAAPEPTPEPTPEPEPIPAAPKPAPTPAPVTYVNNNDKY